MINCFDIYKNVMEIVLFDKLIVSYCMLNQFEFIKRLIF